MISLFIATPCYQGMHPACAVAQAEVKWQLQRLWIPVQIVPLGFHSFVTRARIALMDAFLKSTATHLLWWDADQSVRWRDVQAMLMLDRDILVGATPKKKYPIEFCVKPDGKLAPDPDTGLVPLLRGGTGLMMVSRRAIERMQEVFPNRRWPVEPGGGDCFDVFTPAGPPQGVLPTEDWIFCDLAREAGLKIECLPSVRVTHYDGATPYAGALEDILKFREAEGERSVQVSPMFSIIHGTARPKGWQKAYEAYWEMAEDPSCFRYILVGDAGDGIDWYSEHSGVAFVENHGNPDYVTATNLGASKANAPVLLIASDDMFPPFCWDRKLRQLLPDPSIEAVVLPEVSIPSETMAMQILTRKRYERFGYVFYPGYRSMYADDEFGTVARRDGVVIDGRDLLYFDHRHYVNGLREKDDVDQVNASKERFAHGKALFEQRKAAGFP